MSVRTCGLHASETGSTWMRPVRPRRRIPTEQTGGRLLPAIGSLLSTRPDAHAGPLPAACEALRSRLCPPPSRSLANGPAGGSGDRLWGKGRRLTLEEDSGRPLWALAPGAAGRSGWQPWGARGDGGAMLA